MRNSLIFLIAAKIHYFLIFVVKTKDPFITWIKGSFVPEAGLEPAQPLWPKDFKSFVSTISPFGQHGAKNGTRTRDPDLGKVVLYQLSYFRMMLIGIKREHHPVIPCQGLFRLHERGARSCSTN